MKHNRTLFRSILFAALIGAASCSTSKKVNLNVDLSPVLGMFSDGATVDSVLVQSLTTDGEYQTLGYAQVDGKTATFSGIITEPVFGKIKYYLTVPGGNGSSESIRSSNSFWASSAVFASLSLAFFSSSPNS